MDGDDWRNLLAGSCGTSGKVFSEGNFDHDALSEVNSIDLLILTGHYGKQLPAPAAALGTMIDLSSVPPGFVDQEDES